MKFDKILRPLNNKTVAYIINNNILTSNKYKGAASKPLKGFKKERLNSCQNLINVELA